MNRRIGIFLFFLISYSFAGLVETHIDISNFRETAHAVTNMVFDGQMLTTEGGTGVATSKRFFYLSFDREEERKFIKTKQEVWTKNGFLGNAVAFNKDDDLVTAYFPIEKYFDSTREDKDFSFSFYLYPYDLQGVRHIFFKENIISHRGGFITEGFSVYSVDGRLVVSFKNFFKFRDEAIDIILESSKNLQLNKWQQVKVSYDSYKGLLLLYIDKELVGTKFSTPSGAEGDTIYYPYLRAKSSINSSFFIGGGRGINGLGPHFVGRIDEIEFFNSSDPSSLYRHDETRLETYISKVFFVGYSRSLESIALDTLKKYDKNNVFFYIKRGDEFFKELDEEDVTWEIVDIGEILSQGIKSESDLKPYLQFKISVVNEGLDPLVLRSIRFTFQKIELAPPSLKAVQTGKESVTVSFTPLRDIYIKGYYIYYSIDGFKDDIRYIRMDQTEGMEFLQNERSITIPGFIKGFKYEFYIVSFGDKDLLSPPSVKKGILIRDF